MRDGRKARAVGLALIGLLVGMLLISPAPAHFTQNTRHLGVHAWNEFIKNKVYTKKQADELFLDGSPGAVGTQNLATGAVTGPKLADGSVTAPKLGQIIAVEAPIDVPPNFFVANWSVNCPAGSVLLSGGAEIDGTQTMLQKSTRSSTDPNAWVASARNNDAQTRTLRVQAFCLAT